MSKVLIIDDSDPSIIYSGDWTAGPVTDEYNRTIHRSEKPGDQLSYTFYGTSISVYGTIDSPFFYGGPSTTFSVDGVTPTPFNASGTIRLDRPDILTTHELLYQSPGLRKGVHTLTVTAGTPPSPYAHLSVDFLTVSTGSNHASGTIIVDDRDGAIVYDGPWSNMGVRSEYLGTTKALTGAAGGSATFYFNGTSLVVYGTTNYIPWPRSRAEISFTVDDVPQGMYTGSQNWWVMKHMPLFRMSGLSETQEHTVVMTTHTPNVWFLDYIIYTTGNATIDLHDGGLALDGNALERGSSDFSFFAKGVLASVIGVSILAKAVHVLLRRHNTNRRKSSNAG